MARKKSCTSSNEIDSEIIIVGSIKKYTSTNRVCFTMQNSNAEGKQMEIEVAFDVINNRYAYYSYPRLI